jgi:alpha-D-xyloside xylohydrolase
MKLVMQKEQGLLNEPIDVSEDFYNPDNEYYLPGAVEHYDATTGEGLIQWKYHRWVTDCSFNKMGRHLKQFEEREIFWKEHAVHPVFQFSLSFISSRTIRLRIKTTDIPQTVHPSLMLDGDPPVDNTWQVTDTPEKAVYTSEAGSVVLHKKLWQLEVYDSGGQLLTSTLGAEVLQSMHHKSIPFLFTKRASDYTRSIAAGFSLLPGEKIYGCGESFTALNKKGQKVVLCTTDTQSAATDKMYKPIPFFISSRGHGMFLHTSTPVTFDFGNRFDGSKIMYGGEDQLDLFLFIGSPKEILSEYTALTGRSPLPPLWSFGLWMSRFSYRSQKEVKTIASRIRENNIPCDVIHIDAGWFKNGINCDYEFCKENFPDPKAMMSGLKENGFRTSLWQLPYFSAANPVFAELVAKKLFIQDGNGNVSTDDVVLDFSNPAAREWYTQKIKTLLELGASVIKADFGEAAPYNGYYASGRSGFFEHNLYPLRYTQLLIGGFLSAPKEELFKRWAFFGLFTSRNSAERAVGVQ